MNNNQIEEKIDKICDKLEEILVKISRIESQVEFHQKNIDDINDKNKFILNSIIGTLVVSIITFFLKK